MKTRASLKVRSADCKIVRRKGRLFVINKKNPVEVYLLTFFRIETMNENLLVFFYFELLPCYIYNCVHSFSFTFKKGRNHRRKEG